jgi:DNA sulfur modification protein DndD
MILNLISWKSDGLRCPNFAVNLEKNRNIYPTFLQMPNGTGKTTTLTLLQYCMYEHEFTSKEVWQYRGKKKNYKETGFFEAKFKLDGANFYIKIEFDFKNKTASYSSSIRDGGWKKEFDLPEPLNIIIDKGLIDLLFIDLEKCQTMFRNNQTEAQEAIRKFCKVNILDKIINDLDGYKTKKRKEAVPSGALANDILTEEARNTTIRSKITEVEKKVQEYKKYLNETEEEFKNGTKILKEKIEKDKEIKKKMENLEAKRDKAKINYQKALSENFEKIKKIGTYEGILQDNLKDFVAGLDDLQLPEEDATVFFDELVKRDKCVCGEKLDDIKRKNILSEREKYISIDAATIVNKIKYSVNSNTKESDKTDLDALAKNIQDSKHEYDTLVDDFKLLTKSTLKDDLELHDRIQELKKTRKEKEKFLDTTIKKIWLAKDKPETTESLVSLKEQLVLSNKKLANLTGTQEIESKITLLTNILENAKIEAEQEIASELAIECNKKIKKMLTKDPVYIDSINRNIILQEQQEAASTGQEARIGIIFLLTILERSSIRFPLVVDTPVKGMDKAGKRRTARLISELKSQFLGFVIDSDKDNFSNKLMEYTGEKSNFITAYRRNEEFDTLAGKFQSAPNGAGNGHVVYGYDFFDKFEEEEDFDEEDKEDQE